MADYNKKFNASFKKSGYMTWNLKKKKNVNRELTPLELQGCPMLALPTK